MQVIDTMRVQEEIDASDIRVLMEDDDASMFEPIVLDDDFKERYKGLFMPIGPSSVCMVFGQKHHTRRKMDEP